MQCSGWNWVFAHFSTSLLQVFLFFQESKTVNSHVKGHNSCQEFRPKDANLLKLKLCVKLLWRIILLQKVVPYAFIVVLGSGNNTPPPPHINWSRKKKQKSI